MLHTFTYSQSISLLDPIEFLLPFRFTFLPFVVLPFSRPSLFPAAVLTRVPASVDVKGEGGCPNGESITVCEGVWFTALLWFTAEVTESDGFNTVLDVDVGLTDLDLIGLDSSGLRPSLAPS